MTDTVWLVEAETRTKLKNKEWTAWEPLGEWAVMTQPAPRNDPGYRTKITAFVPR